MTIAEVRRAGAAVLVLACIVLLAAAAAELSLSLRGQEIGRADAALLSQARGIGAGSVHAVIARRLDPGVHPAADAQFEAAWIRSHDLIMPVLDARASDLSDTFRQVRSGGRRHEAIDIHAARGTPVLAVTDGVIVRLALHDSGGVTLYLAAPDNQTVFYYAHLASYAEGVHEGMAVRQGDVIGHVGSTGNAGPGNYHLHFEMQTAADPQHSWTGKPRNPYPLLVRARG